MNQIEELLNGYCIISLFIWQARTLYTPAKTHLHNMYHKTNTHT